MIIAAKFHKNQTKIATSKHDVKISYWYKSRFIYIKSDKYRENM